MSYSWSQHYLYPVQWVSSQPISSLCYEIGYARYLQSLYISL